MKIFPFYLYFLKKYGKNKKLEEINKAKWKSVIDAGDKIKYCFQSRK